MVQFGRQHDHGLKVFRGWEIFNKSLPVVFILTVIFTNPNLATNVKPDLEPLFDCTKVVPLGIRDNSAIISSDILCRSFGVYTKGHKIPRISLQICKIAISCNYRKIFQGVVTTREVTEKVISPKKCLGAVKNRTILTAIGTQHLVQINPIYWKNIFEKRASCLRGVTTATIHNLWRF